MLSYLSVLVSSVGPGTTPLCLSGLTGRGTRQLETTEGKESASSGGPGVLAATLHLPSARFPWDRVSVTFAPGGSSCENEIITSPSVQKTEPIENRGALGTRDQSLLQKPFFTFVGIQAPNRFLSPFADIRASMMRLGRCKTCLKNVRYRNPSKGSWD